METQKTKQQMLLESIGFKPMTDKPDCTLYERRGDNGVTIIQTSNEDLDELKKKYSNDIDKIIKELKEKTRETFKNASGSNIDTQDIISFLQKKAEENEVKGEKEILPFEDVAVESDQYMYMAELLKSVPLPVLRRITYNDKRFYFEVLETGEVQLYSSATTLISDGYVDTSGGLDAWRLKQRILGKDPDAIAKERADLGTIMHFMFGCLLMKLNIPFSIGGIKAFMKSHYDDLKIDRQRIDYIMDKYAVELLEDIRSFLKWVKDYNVKPLAIELMLRSERWMVASAVDLICEMDKEITETGYFGEVYKRKTGDKNAGDPKLSTKTTIKRVVAIVDFKSNRDGNFYPSYALQLELYKRMVYENFGDLLEIDGIYNFAPKTWGDGRRPYHFRERTEDRELRKADCVFEQGRINHIFKEPKITCYLGNASVENEFNLESCIRTIPLVDYLQDPANWLR